MNTISSLFNWIGNTIGANPNTLTTTSKTLVGAINEIGTDYIVEQGTSNGWTYRKWDSGIAECWKTIDAGTPAMTSVEGSAYYATRSYYNFPSGLFSEAPRVTCGAMMGGALGNFTLASATKSTFDGFWWCTRSTSAYPCKLDAHAIGEWE